MRSAKGAGSVEKAGGGYRARRKVGGQVTVGQVRTTRLEAEKDRQSLRVKSARRKDSPTVGEYAQELLLGRFKKKLRQSTWETNEIIWRCHVSTAKLGRTKIEKVNRRAVQGFIDDLVGSPAWVRRIGAFVSVVFTNAVQDELLTSNPAYRIDYPEVEERENRTLTPAEAIKLLNPKDRLGAMVLLACHTGLRRGELCGLRWEDVRDGFIRVRRAIAANKGGDVETKVKSKTSMADIPLTPEAVEAIKSQTRRGTYVFSVEDGGPVSPSNLSRDWRAWADKNGLKGMRLHDLRGSYVSLLIENGADIRTVQELARHADPRTTMKLYARTRKPVKEAAIQKLQMAIGHKIEHNEADVSQNSTQAS